MDPVFIGIDPDSKRISVAITIGEDDHGFKVRRKHLPESKSVGEWCNSARRFVYGLVREYADKGHPVFVGIERPFASPHSPSAVVPLARLNGAMHAGAYMAGATTYDCIIQSWKKEVCGAGNMTKPQIAAWAKLYWRNLWDEAQTILVSRGRQDVIDAGCINRYTKSLVEREQRLSLYWDKHQDEAPPSRVRKK